MRSEQLSGRSASILRTHARYIQRLGRRALGDVVEIGRRLKDAKRRVGHGRFLCWIAAEFDWSEDTAERFVRVHDLISKNRNLRNLKVPISALYLLAAPSVPDRALVEVAHRVGEGERLSVDAVMEVIANTRRLSPIRHMCRLAAQIVREVGADDTQLSDVPQIAARHCAALHADLPLGDQAHLRHILKHKLMERLAACESRVDQLQREIEKLEALQNHITSEPMIVEVRAA